MHEQQFTIQRRFELQTKDSESTTQSFYSGVSENVSIVIRNFEIRTQVQDDALESQVCNYRVIRELATYGFFHITVSFQH